MDTARKLRRERMASLVLVPALLLWAVPASIGQDAGEPSAAPPNPDFVRYLDRVAAGAEPATTDDGYALGAVPGPVDLSHAAGQQLKLPKQPLAQPPAYDLRTIPGKLPPVRNQANCGSCWAFGAYGSLESCLRPAETWDFSEMDMICAHGFDYTQCYGGHHWMSTAYLGRWDGPVNESCYPYASSPYNCTIPRPSCPVQKHVQEVVFIPPRSGPTDNNNIKTAVMSYGPVYTTYYHNNAYYNSENYSYYYTGSSSINHAVCIVGWDDSYSRYNFLSTPDGDGAFIIRNSWGPGWGQAGYFYMSYYDSTVGNDNALFRNGESIANYNRVYQYDPLGWVSSTGYGTTTAWCANIFTAAASEQLAAVSTYAVTTNVSYVLYVYLNATSGPRSGTLAASQSGTMANMGYQTISLTSPPSLTNGQKFSVVLRLTSPGYNWPVPFEYPYSGYSSGATGNAGESYRSSNGTYWTDMTSLIANSNVCVKAFTAPPPPEACCLPDGSCLDIAPIECINVYGGAPRGPGTSCSATTEACCLPDGSCLDADPLCCTSMGGTPQGAGTSCSPTTVACCFKDGSCMDVDPLCCDDLGGENKDPGTHCLGDANGNEIDDACEDAGPYFIEFSLDIGSDTELSDPSADGNEGFDPGDVYLWQGPPVTPPGVPGGNDGFKDDLTIFLQDPPSDPPDFFTPPATRVPVGSGDPSMHADFFDLDGHDQISFSLIGVIPQFEPLPGPLYSIQSPCIHEVRYLAVSYDDDMARGWTAGDVPVTVPSPRQARVYGTACGRDEVMGLILGPGPGGPGAGFALQVRYPLADEVTVHADLAPNPTMSCDTNDDDVDSLDIVPGEGPGQSPCSVWLFSADHEATFIDPTTGLPMDPGGIYEVTAGGPIQVIDEIHLGISEDADIDDFELALMQPDQGAPLALVLLFSVDEDEPITPENESGGLDAAMIYGSFLDGASFPLLVDANGQPAPLWDDVDALTAWKDQIGEPLPDGPFVIGWRSVRTHGPTMIPLGVALDNCSPCGTSEPREGGFQQIEVEFDRPVVLTGVQPVAVDLTNGTGPYPAVPFFLTPDGMTLRMDFGPNPLPNMTCYDIDLSAVIAGLGGDPDCRVVNMSGDVDGDFNVTLTDALKAKDNNAQPIDPRTCRSDLDVDANITLTDALQAKDLNGNAIKCPSCP